MVFYLIFNNLLFFSQKKNEFQLIFKNAYNNEPFENCIVKIYDEENRFITEEKSNSEGEVVLKNLKSNNFKIRANSIDSQFVGIASQISFENDVTQTFYLYPNEQYEAQILKLEDSLHINEEVFLFVEEEAKFNGNIIDFIIKNLHFSEKNIEISSLEISVKFIIEVDGSISHISVTGSSEYKNFNNEVIRVIRNMPKWTPGKQKGINVRTWVKIPIHINFQ